MIIANADSEKKRILNNVVVQMGGTVEEYIGERNCYSVELSGKSLFLEHHIVLNREPYIGVISTKCKDITQKMLTEASLPVPNGASFYFRTFKKDEASKQLDRLNYPIVLKQAKGSNSLGVFVNVPDKDAALDILKNELKGYRSMIAQEMVYGKEHRVLVLDNKVIAALEMIHPYVVGDGKTKLKTLIRTKQNTTDKRTPFDKRLKQLLKKQGYSLKSVIPESVNVTIKGNCSLAEGGETKDVTDLVHQDVVDACVKASEVVGKYLVGIDLMCEDISKEQGEGTMNILEVNGKPDYSIHYNPTHGASQNVLKHILEFIVK
ncbi:MAG: ATP-grasp domain-containing protein [bacterium]|nr:ATP-grasp domain-containing protein [bacterium]